MSRESGLRLEPLTGDSWGDAAAIYAAGIVAGNATFETEAPDWDAFSAKLDGLPALVARDDGGAIVGWAALTPASSRCVYRGVGAVSIYVAPASAGRGVGTALLSGLVEAAERAGLWTLEAGIFPENVASIAIHERCGFRLVGVRERLGQMPDGRWRDVLLFERRSGRVGSAGKS